MYHISTGVYYNENAGLDINVTHFAKTDKNWNDGQKNSFLTEMLKHNYKCVTVG